MENLVAVRTLKIEDSLFEIKDSNESELSHFTVGNYLNLREFNFTCTKEAHYQFIFSLSIRQILEDLKTLLRVELGDGASIHTEWCNGFFKVILELDFEAPTLTTPKELELLIDQSAFFISFEVYFDLQKSCLYPSLHQIVALSEVPVYTWNKIESVVQKIFRIDLPNSSERSFYGEQVLKQIFEFSNEALPIGALAAKKILDRCIFLKFLTDESGENIDIQISSHKTPMPMSGRPYQFLQPAQTTNEFFAQKIDLTKTSLLGLFAQFAKVSELDSSTLNDYVKKLPQDICGVLLYKLLSPNTKNEDRKFILSAIQNLPDGPTKVALQLQYARKYEDYSAAISCLKSFLNSIEEPLRQKLYSPGDLLGSLYLKAGLSQQALEYLKQSLLYTPNKRRITLKIEFIETFLQGTRTQMREKELLSQVDLSYQKMLNLYNTNKKEKEILQIFSENLDLFAMEPLKLSFLVKLLLENNLHSHASSLLEKVSLQGSCDVALLQQYIADLSLKWRDLDSSDVESKSEIKVEGLSEDRTTIIDSSSYRNIQSELQEMKGTEENLDTQLNKNSNVPVENFEDSLFRIEHVSDLEKNAVEKFKIPSEDESHSSLPEEFVAQELVEFNTSLRPFAIPAIDSKIAARFGPIDDNLDLSEFPISAEVKSDNSPQPILSKKLAQALDFDWRAAIAQNTVEAGQTSIV